MRVYPSLMREFHIVIIAVIIVIVVSSAVFIESVYKMNEDVSLHDLKFAATKIEHDTIFASDYAEYVMRQVTSLIAHNSENLHYVEDILSSFKIQSNVSNILPWNMFTWVNSKGLGVVNSEIGILPKPIDFSHHDYYPLTIIQPGVIHISQDVTNGMISHKRIISTGMGITDKNQRYLGFLLFGISVNGLVKKIRDIVYPQNIEFALLNSNYEIVAKFPENSCIFTASLTNKISQLNINNAGEGKIDVAGDYFKNVGYYFHIFPSQSYIMLLAYSSHNNLTNVLNAIAPKIIDVFVVLGLILSCFFVIYQRIVRPIVLLHNVMLDGKYGVAPNFYSVEINTIAQHIWQMSKYEEEIQELHDELNKKTIDAEIANRTRNEFIACISHELYTPLNIITSFAKIMKDQTLGPMSSKKYLEYSKYIYDSGMQLSDVVNNILDISKAESHMISLRKSSVNLQKVLSDIFSLFMEDITRKKLSIYEEYPERIPILIGDTMRIRQAFMHIISNAIKFTNDNGAISVIVRYVQSFDKIESIIVNVKDTGIGMASEQIKLAFSSFSQLDVGLDRKFEGTGLGLPIAKKLIEMHDGTVNIIGKVGEGTEVIVKFTESIVAPEN